MTAAHKKLQGTTTVPGPCSYCVTLMPSKRGPDSAPRPSWPDCMAGQGAWGKLKKPPFSTTIGNASPKTCVPRATTVTDSIRVRWAPGQVSGRNVMSPQVTQCSHALSKDYKAQPEILTLSSFLHLFALLKFKQSLLKETLGCAEHYSQHSQRRQRWPPPC